MKKLIVVILFVLVSFSAFAEGIVGLNRKNGIELPPRDIPKAQRHGVGFDLGGGRLGGNLLFIYTYTSSDVSTSQVKTELNKTESEEKIIHPFGFRFSGGIGTNYLIPSLRFSFVPEWIFYKFLLNASDKTTDVLDLSLGGGLDFDIKFQEPENGYHIALFGSVGVTYSFFNHWTVFFKLPLGYGIVSNDFKGYKNGFFYNPHLGFTYEF